MPYTVRVRERRDSRLRRFVRAAVAIPLLGASFALASAGAASAAPPSVVGMTYDKAKVALSKADIRADIATRTGTELQQGDCIVVNQVLRPGSSRYELGSSGTVTEKSRPATLMLSLNCNAPVASAGQAGNSAASPAGRAAKQHQADVAYRQTPEGQVACAQLKKQHPDYFPLEGCPN